MAALSPLAGATSTPAASPPGSPAVSAPIATPPASRPQLLLINGRLVVAGSADSHVPSDATVTAAAPQVNAPDAEKSLGRLIAAENGPSAAPAPPSRAELEAQLASLSAQSSTASPDAPEATNLELKEAQIRQALAELTISPGSYGSARANLRGLATDKVA